MKKLYLTILYSLTAIIIVSTILVRLFNGSLDLKKGSVDCNGISEININMTFGEVEITYGSDYSIRYEYLNHEPEIKVENDIVTIDYNYSKEGLKKEEVKIYITVISDVIVNKVNVNCNVIDLDIEGCLIDTLKIDSKVCDIDLKKSNINSITMVNDVSNVNIKSTQFNTLNFESKVCNLDITSFAFEEYNYNITCDSGSIKVNGDNYLKEYVKANGALKDVIIKCKVSNIEIEKN